MDNTSSKVLYSIKRCILCTVFLFFLIYLHIKTITIIQFQILFENYPNIFKSSSSRGPLTMIPCLPSASTDSTCLKVSFWGFNSFASFEFPFGMTNEDPTRCFTFLTSSLKILQYKIITKIRNTSNQPAI